MTRAPGQAACLLAGQNSAPPPPPPAPPPPKPLRSLAAQRNLFIGSATGATFQRTDATGVTLRTIPA